MRTTDITALLREDEFDADAVQFLAASLRIGARTPPADLVLPGGRPGWSRAALAPWLPPERAETHPAAAFRLPDDSRVGYRTGGFQIPRPQ